MGSCFADNICRKMRDCLWDAENPLSVLFNPLSIAKNIDIALGINQSPCLNKRDFPSNEVFLKSKKRVEESVFADGEVYHSWLCDSHFSALTAFEVAANIRKAFNIFYKRVKRGDTLIITFGTSRCYFLKSREESRKSREESRESRESREEREVVANCHKQPQSLFECRRISVKEITERWHEVILKLREVNPDIRIIFTVSPVRHLKDGFVENALSKATLLLAVEEICREEEGCEYFPAFEIVNDDLRDYRFYASDFVHPSEEAVEYIWEKFKDAFLTESDRKLLKEGESLRRRTMHRSIVSGTKAERRFREETEELMTKFLEGKGLGFRF